MYIRWDSGNDIELTPRDLVSVPKGTENVARQIELAPEVSRGQEAQERRTLEREPERHPKGFKGRERKDTIS